MRIIDSKGKIFGVINVIDFAVILFVVSLFPMAHFGWKLFTAPTSMSTGKICMSEGEYEALKHQKEYKKLKAIEAQVIEFTREWKKYRKHFREP